MTRYILLLPAVLLSLHHINGQTKQITGFSAESAARHLLLEEKYDAALSAENIGNTIQQLSSQPHHLGSKGGKAAQSINRLSQYLQGGEGK